jgi:hypothetical protein
MTATFLGFSRGQIAAAIGCMLLHPNLGRRWFYHPVLIDAPSAMLIALGCYACVVGDIWLWAVACVASAFVRESNLLLLAAAAVFRLDPVWCGVVLVICGGLYAAMRAQMPVDPATTNPLHAPYFGPLPKVVRNCVRHHGHRLLDLQSPWWGLFPLALLGIGRARPELLDLWPMVVAAYLMPLLGTDRDRLAAQAWPMVILLACSGG